MTEVTTALITAAVQEVAAHDTAMRQHTPPRKGHDHTQALREREQLNRES